MRPPCEQIVRYVLPTFRSLVARELVENHHFSQVDAAKRLGTTQAAISHYLSSKRGDKRMKQLEKDPQIISISKEVAKGIANEKYSLLDGVQYFCKLCSAIKEQNIIL